MNADSIRSMAERLPEDAKERTEIYQAARELMFAAEPPRETAFRVLFSNAATAAAVVAVDIGLFRALVNEPTRSHSVAELAKKTGAEEKLLLRLLRTLTAFGTMAQISRTEFKATKNTIALTSPFSEQISQVQTQFTGHVMLALPEYLKKKGYKNPSNHKDTAFHQAYNTNLEIFEWFNQPENQEWNSKFMTFMSVQRFGQIPWMPNPQFLNGYDIALSPADLAKGRAQFVDIGGAVGHQCIAFRKAYPSLNGPVILLDQPFIVGMARANPRIDELRVTVQNHDFLTPMTLEAKGAKVFYIRNVLHDWNDDQNAIILSHIRDAMVEDSLLIIDEAVVPDMNVALTLATCDMVMMAMPAALERDEAMWRDLVEKQVGLKIVEIRAYDEASKDSLIFVRKH